MLVKSTSRCSMRMAKPRSKAGQKEGMPTDEDIESFWDGLRPPREPGASSPPPKAKPSVEIADIYLTHYDLDYGADSGVEVRQANVTFEPITDPPYSSLLTEEDRNNITFLRATVESVEQLRILLGALGIRHNFVRLIDQINARATELNIHPSNPRSTYYQETADHL